MNPVTLTTLLAAADDDGVAQNQTPSGAGNLTLNGALVSGGVATLATTGVVRQVLITTASDESAKTLTIYGTNADGAAISETVTGPNATTGTTTMYYQTVTRVAVSAAFTGNVKVGTNGVGSSRIVNPDYFVDQFQIGVGSVVSGTVNFTVQVTYEDIQSLSALTWFDVTALAGKTASTDAAITTPCRGLRVKINSGTGTVTTNIIQVTSPN